MGPERGCDSEHDINCDQESFDIRSLPGSGSGGEDAELPGSVVSRE